MTCKQRLEAKGWYLTQEWIDQVSTGDPEISLTAIINQALTHDLHNIGQRILPEDGGKTPVEEIYGPMVLQIQKVRNVLASKANAKNKGIPTLLRIFLTDGFASCSALQNGSLQKIKWNTPAGTKILLTSIVPVRGGFVLINDSNIELLGGSLPPEPTKTAAIVPVNGLKPPPLWVEFGQAIDMVMVAKAKELRSLEVLTDSEKPLENPQFDDQRNMKIQEVVTKKLANKSRYSAPAVYRAPRKQPQPPRSENSYKISASKASRAAAPIKMYNYDLAESMHNLRLDPDEQPVVNNNQRGGRGRGRRRGGHDSSDIQQRPSTGNTLFDFLESHLPSSQEETTKPSPMNGSQDYYPNNFFASPKPSRNYSQGMGSNSGYMSQPMMFRSRGRMGGDYSRNSAT